MQLYIVLPNLNLLKSSKYANESIFLLKFSVSVALPMQWIQGIFTTNFILHEFIRK